MIKMGLLPILIFSVALLKVSLGVELTTIASQSGADKITCPGSCVEESFCSVALNDANCSEGLVCCLNIDESTTTEYSEHLTTEGAFEYSSAGQDYEEAEVEVQDQEGDEAVAYSAAEDEADENPDYTYVFSEESDAFSLDRSGDMLETCPGTCVPFERSEECEYITTEFECSSEYACCLTEEELRITSQRYSYLVTHEDETNVQMKRPIPYHLAQCPGTCVHPSHALFCEQILPQYPCPLNSKCCIKRSTEPSTPSELVKCTGQCLPSNMHGYCFPPNELIMVPTTCQQGTCCMKTSSESVVQPPSVSSMQYPDIQYRVSTSDPSQIVLGHLAVDDEGTVFKVGTSGQVSPLPQLVRRDHMYTRYNKLLVYPRPDGHIVIYSDSLGELYQHFYPDDTYNPDSPFGDRPSEHYRKFKEPKRPRKPVYDMPDEGLHAQEVDVEPEDQTRLTWKGKGKVEVKVEREREMESSHQDSGAFPVEKKEEIPIIPEEIVIPDDEDEPPVVESKPEVVENKTSRPSCPGSCMSDYLRFTCFRGVAIYDGFSCPGRTVCCAQLQDIENREKRLRELSPLSKESLESGKSAVKCGIKGRKDSPNAAGESLPGTWCWQVAIINVLNQYMCGGALIGDSWVLTAAHCVAGPVRENQAVFVRAGVTDLKSPEDNSQGQTIRVVATYIHHKFNSINLDNNIALLQLQKPVGLVNNVCVVCLPIDSQMPAENSKCSVTGYGFVSKGGEMSLKIKEAQLSIIDDTECMANVTEALLNPFILPASSFCAGGQSPQDACQGDAGGPLVCEVGDHHELIGLVSWTLGCGIDDVPSIYVNIPAFMGWINQVLSSSSILTSLK